MSFPRPDRANDFGGSSAFVNRRWGRDLEDEFLACYVRWREASADVRLAYEHWRCSVHGQGAGAFAVFQAALDQEESAARDYCDVATELAVVAAAS